MYPVSQAYTTAIRALSRTDRISGTLVFPDDEEININETIIGEGTVAINRQCVESEEIQFGAAPLGQLKMSIRSSESRFKFFGAVISLTYGVLVSGTAESGTWFDMPLGVFTVGEAERNGSVVQVVAYDNLKLLDKTYDNTVLYGRPYDQLCTIAEICDIEFSMTEEQIEAFPNGSDIIQIDQTSGCATFRDCVKIIAQMLGCFAIADRTGELVLKRYEKTAVTSYAAGNRYSKTLADYTCQYSGIVIQSSTGKYSAYDEEIEEGLEYYIEDAPAWDYGAAATLQARTEALLAELVQLTYTPCTLSIPGDPAIECGDMVGVVEGETTYNAIITSTVWKYHGRMSLESTGVNPFLNARQTKKSRQTRELEDQSRNNRLIFYGFTNNDDLVIPSDVSLEIARVTFVTTEETSAMFLAQIPLTATVADETYTNAIERSVTVKNQSGQTTSVLDPDGNPLTFTVSDNQMYKLPGKVVLQIFYYMNGSLIDYELKHTLRDGKDILTLYYPFSGLQAKTNSTFSVRMRIISGNGTVEIERHAMKATITGQGLASTDAWTGAINIDEVMPRENMRSVLGIPTYTENISIAQQVPTPRGIADSSGRFTMRSTLGIRSITDYLVPGTVVVQQTTVFTNNGYTETVDGETKLKSVFDYNSTAGTIDTGSLSVITIPTSDKQAIQSCEVNIDG